MRKQIMEKNNIQISFESKEGMSPVASVHLAIFIGQTGVGKSTTLEILSKNNPNLVLLPDRRTLTDLVIIPQALKLQKLDDVIVADRVRRFELTKFYREKISSAGMANVLNTIYIEESKNDRLFLFDGLRGENEIRYAVSKFPKAHFIMLDAPDFIRVQRLIQRRSSFDMVDKKSVSSSEKFLKSYTEIGLPQGDKFFDKDEVTILLNLVNTRVVELEDLLSKTKIVLKESENYSPKKARAVLKSEATNRSLIIDTSKNKPDEVARLITKYLESIKW